MNDGNGKMRSLEDHRQKCQRAYVALEKLLERTLQPGFTGSAALELDVHRGGINQIRIALKELQ